MSDEIEPTETEPPFNESAVPTAAPAPQLALNDLAAVIQIIDVASSRGAFRGEELSQVGGVRDRLSAFLKASAPPPPESPEEGVEDEAVEES